MNDGKRMNIRELRERGYLHEINRLLLHPLSLALEVGVVKEAARTITLREVDAQKVVEALTAFESDARLDPVVKRLLNTIEQAPRSDVGDETLSGVWDCRDDPEGVCYGDDLLSAEKAAQVASDVEERGSLRKTHLGFVVQPLPTDVKHLNVTIKEPFDEERQAPPPYLRFAPSSGIEFPDDES